MSPNKCYSEMSLQAFAEVLSREIDPKKIRHLYQNHGCTCDINHFEFISLREYFCNKAISSPNFRKYICSIDIWSAAGLQMVKIMVAEMRDQKNN